jgi:hypothetical protein
VEWPPTPIWGQRAGRILFRPRASREDGRPLTICPAVVSLSGRLAHCRRFPKEDPEALAQLGSDGGRHVEAEAERLPRSRRIQSAMQANRRGPKRGREKVFVDELTELRLTAEETQSVIRRQLTRSLAVALAIGVFAFVTALYPPD